jgi:hypothetical protein
LRLRAVFALALRQPKHPRSTNAILFPNQNTAIVVVEPLDVSFTQVIGAPNAGAFFEGNRSANRRPSDAVCGKC